MAVVPVLAQPATPPPRQTAPTINANAIPAGKGSAARTQRNNASQMFGREPWPAQRVILLLPLQFGTGWNVDRERAAFILPDAEQKLQQALQRTGKFSTTQLHRYNSIFLRAVQEKALTKEQVSSLLAAPTVDAVQAAMGKIHFDQPPLIAEVTMDEVTTEAGAPIPTVRAQVTGKLYEVSDPTPVKSVVVTSAAQPLYYAAKRGKNPVYVRRSAAERILTAADNAFGQIATEFVKPLEEIILPEPIAPPADTAIVPADGETNAEGRPVITVPQGQVLGTFSAPAR
jgi:hypothetical protein